MARVADASQDAVLVPIVPSQLRDSQGFTWASAIVARNFSAAEVPIQCSEPECPRARAGSEFYRSGRLMNAERPSLLFIPADRRGDLAMTESISAESLAVVQFQSHELRIPLVRLGDLTAHRLTFLDVRASTYHDRTTLRVYSPWAERPRGRSRCASTTGTTARRAAIVWRSSSPVPSRR